MTPQQASNILRHFNEWCREERNYLPHSEEAIGEAIDMAVVYLARADQVKKALSELVTDLEVRATFDSERVQGVVACGATVYKNAKAALEDSK